MTLIRLDKREMYIHSLVNACGTRHKIKIKPPQPRSRWDYVGIVRWGQKFDAVGAESCHIPAAAISPRGVLICVLVGCGR